MSFIEKITPPGKWKTPVTILIGIIVGMGALIFHISNASSYLSDEPETCINCHVMFPQYTTWAHSSHREAAVCNDCHVPHENVVRKYYFKANDGARHATIFTLGTEPQVIQMKEAGIQVVQNNCERCHWEQISRVSIADVSGENYMTGQGKLCWGCHREVPHGRVRSEASAINALIPYKKPSVADFMKDTANYND